MDCGKRTQQSTNRGLKINADAKAVVPKERDGRNWTGLPRPWQILLQQQQGKWKNIQTAHPPTTIKPEHATPIRWAIDAKKKRTACRTRWNLKFWQGDEDGGGGEDGENNSAMESSQTEVVFLVSLGPPRAILLDTNAINYKVCRSLNGSFNLIFVSGGQWLLIPTEPSYG